jgi:WD40 repeat protein
MLLMEDEDGLSYPISGQDLGMLLHDQRSLRLVILNACEGARTSQTDPFAGSAQSLVQQGIPAVIAMQFELSDDAAIVIAHEFYGALADGYPVDAALAEARKALFAIGSGTEWGTPVLYLRAPDGKIFDIARRPRRTRPTATSRSAEQTTVVPVVQPPTTSSHLPWPLIGAALLIIALLAVKGHTAFLTSVAFSPDGKYVVTASGDNTVRIWDVSTAKTVLVLQGHAGWVTSAVFSPDGTRIATTSGDTTARVWDADTGKELASFIGHRALVSSAIFSQDGTRVLTGGDTTARIWNAATGKEQLVFVGHTGGVNSAAFSADGRRVATASADGTARLWDAKTGKVLAEARGETGILHSVVFSPDGQYIFTSSGDGTARIWDVHGR